MISMEMMGKIRRMYFRDKLSLHEIAKRTGLARNTIRKWVRAPEAKPPVYQRRAIFNKLSPFHATLEQALKADSLRPKQQRRSAKALLAQIKAEGYDGGYSQLTAFIRAWRGGQGKASRAFVPLTFALGEAFQFDWSEEGLLVGGIYRRMQVAHLKLCASRAFWLVAYPSQGHEMLFDAHTRSFGSLGGVPRRGIYDNMKTAVDKVNKGKGRAVNARFAVMCAHYLFDPDFCNVAAGWEKGIVEKNVQDSRRRIWLDSITMPERGQFPSADNYYATALHELGHWTGHPSRLDRDLSNPFGSEGYAKEELRAEISSMILGNELGIGHDPGQHVAYVGSWIKVLQEDPLEIFRAAADAEKIQAFVLAFEQQQVQDHQVDTAQLGQEQAEVLAHIQEAHKNANPGYSALESWQTLERTAEANGLKAMLRWSNAGEYEADRCASGRVARAVRLLGGERARASR